MKKIFLSALLLFLVLLPHSSHAASPEAYTRYILSSNRSIGSQKASQISQAALEAGAKYNLDPSLLLAIAWRESNFDARCVTGDCYGLMQIHVKTGASAGLSVSQLYDAKSSMMFGAKYLRSQLNSFGTLTKALSAYNQGPIRVKKGNFKTGYATQVLNRQQAIKKYIGQ